MEKFYGLSTLRTGLEKSRNLMTVRIAQSLGINKIANFQKSLVLMKILVSCFYFAWIY